VCAGSVTSWGRQLSAGCRRRFERFALRSQEAASNLEQFGNLYLAESELDLDRTLTHFTLRLFRIRTVQDGQRTTPQEARTMQRTRLHIFVALVLTFIALAVTGAVAQQQNPRQLFERARMLDESNQNLTEAIKLYGQVVKQAQEQRALAARAQLRVGLLYERLGRKAEAQRAFQLVVSQYADQADVVRQAQAKLPTSVHAKSNTNATSKAATGPTVRQVWVGPDADGMGQPSPDGRFLSFVDWDTGDLAIRDLSTGENRRITNKGSYQQSKEEAYESIFSPDGKRLAYIWHNKENSFDLRLIGVDGSGLRVLYKDKSYAWPQDWSLDGKYILAESVQERDHKILLISVADGSARVLKTLPSFYPRIFPGGKMMFSPDGRYIVYSAKSREGAQERDVFLLSTDGSLETTIVQHPEDDYVLGWTPDGSHILFASKRIGNTSIWAVPVAEGRVQGPIKLIRRDLEGIWPQGFTRSGAFYFHPIDNQMSDIYTAALDLATGKLLAPPKMANQRYVGFLNRAPKWSPDGKRFAYLSIELKNRVPASRTILLVSSDTGQERQMPVPLGFELVAGAFRWTHDGRSLILVGKINNSSPGFYQVDTQSGEAKFLMPNQYGAQVFAPWLSPDGKTIVYQAINKAILVRNLETGEERTLYQASQHPRMNTGFSISPDNQLVAFSLHEPDQGFATIHIVPIGGAGAGKSLQVKTPLTGQQELNATWSPEGHSLFFLLRQTGKSLRELWQISVADGKARRLELAMDGLRDIDLHPDGRRAAFAVFANRSEIWVMENFLPAVQTRRTSVSR
jgi:Tol biopolymer transport system component